MGGMRRLVAVAHVVCGWRFANQFRNSILHFFLCVGVFMKPFSEQIRLFANSILKTPCVDCFQDSFTYAVHVVGCVQINAKDL